VVMKVVTGFYLWGIIATIFFRWSLGERGERSKYRGKLVPSAEALDVMVGAEGSADEASEPQPTPQR